VETVQEKRPIPATPEPKQSINKGTPQAVTATPPTAATTTTSKADNKPKLGSLAALRQKIQEENPNGVVIIDHPLEMNRLEAAWAQFIHQLKEEKNPAAQSFEMSQLVIIDNNSFEAVVNNNISQRFLEFERNKASEFFQKQLQNRQLQFLIRLEETEQEAIVYERPLSAKEQYQKLIEQFPLVKELRERLKMDLDF
jgi:DNA polymerase-3 subunit gamma/tau